MHRDIVISVIFHVMVITALWASGQLINGHKINPDDVIKVSLVSLPELAPSPPTSAPPALKSAEPPVRVPNTKAKPIAAKPKSKPKEKPKPQRELTAKEEAELMARAEGKAEIGQAAGSPFAGATVDNANFDYPYWFTQAFYKIQTNWHNPVDADGPLVCVVYFQVLKSGRIVEARVDRTSGFPAFDQACVTAVDRSSPFPPFPKEFGDEILGITIPFKYQP
ncbi:MAG: TonB C-terminal domain-containing protein [candidate division Zixibacteria bacterium]|nr:TonB C-terminal domain-containing protein [candidate division Zixibacteria bacterium]